MKPKSTFLIFFAALGFTAANATDIDPSIGKKNDINGLVTEMENKKPMSDVNVTAFLSSKKEKIATATDADGNYAFDDLKPGTYRLIFEKLGYKKVVKENVVIRPDEAFQMNIEMTENGDFDLVPTPLHFF